MQELNSNNQEDARASLTQAALVLNSTDSKDLVDDLVSSLEQLGKVSDILPVANSSSWCIIVFPAEIFAPFIVSVSLLICGWLLQLTKVLEVQRASQILVLQLK